MSKLTKTSEYTIWIDMRRRCYDENNSNYLRYGARGIKVCDRWVESFWNFFEDMGERPSKRYSIERKDNDGDYCKENCFWATMKVQSNNRRTNRLIEYNGKTQTMQQWADEIGISKHTINKRLKSGWSIEKTLTTKVDFYKIITYDGKSQSLADWVRELGLKYGAINGRLQKGWSIEEAFSIPLKDSNNENIQK